MADQPVYSYGKQLIDDQDIEAVVRALKSDYLTQGPAVTEFEDALKKRFGVKHAFALNNGTSALHLAGLALGWSEKDLVLTTPLTFLASSNAVLFCNAKVDFVDVDPVYYTIDCKLLEEKLENLKKKNQKVSAVIAVDFAGQPCDWKRLNELSKKYGFVLIDDGSHALGTKSDGVEVCSGKLADIVTLSFHPVKHVTTAEGGALLTNNDEIAHQARVLKTHGMVRDESLWEDASPGPWYYEMQELGYNFRLPDVLCALGTSQLSKLDRFLEKRNAIAKKYGELLAGAPLILPKIRENAYHAFHLYAVQFDFKKAGLSKKQFFENMKRDGVLLQVHYIPVHLQPYYRKRFGYKKGDFPIAESFYENEFSIPMYPALNDSDLIRIVGILKKNLGLKD